MLKINKKNKNFVNLGIYIIVVIVLIIIVFIFSKFNLFADEVSANDYVENVSMIITSPSWSLEYQNISTENVTVADLLFECASLKNFTVDKEFWQGYNSFFIEAINDIQNGEEDKYWQYYVNGEFAGIGSSSYLLEDNDVVEWRFEKSQWS